MVDHYNNGPQINHTSCIHKKRKKEKKKEKEGASALKTLLVVIRGDFCSHERIRSLFHFTWSFIYRVCVMSHINQDIPELIGSAVWCTVRLSLVFGNASCFSITFRNCCSPDTATPVLPLANFLFHFDHMSNEDGDVTFLRSLEIINNRSEKHSMYLMYFTIIAHNSKLWLFIRVRWGYWDCWVFHGSPCIFTELWLGRRHWRLRCKHK